MKTIQFIYVNILIISLLLISCNEDRNIYAPIGGTELKMEVSSDTIILKPENENINAVTFSWNKGWIYNDCINKDYCFKIDIADNNFKSATELEILGKDIYEKKFTVEELNDLCFKQWNVKPGEKVYLEAKVIARLTSDKFLKPEIATIKFEVQTYRLPSKDLYIIGDAVCNNETSIGWNLENALLMNEDIFSTQYSYKGRFLPGKFCFLLSKNSLLPGYYQANSEDSIKLCKDKEELKFVINKAAKYELTVNVKERTLLKVYYPEFESIYMVGDATPGGWSIDDAFALTWIKGTSKFVYEGLLKKGELKFSAGERSWNAPFFMAIKENCDNLSINNMQLVYYGGSDYKWVITKEAKYRIVLDIDNLKIQFEEI